VRINALAPGQIDTLGGGEPIDNKAHSAYVESVAVQLPVGRIGIAQETARAALLLGEDTFTTGTLDVNGASADQRVKTRSHMAHRRAPRLSKDWRFLLCLLSSRKLGSGSPRRGDRGPAGRPWSYG
jgi:hypothetical protein